MFPPIKPNYRSVGRHFDFSNRFAGSGVVAVLCPSMAGRHLDRVIHFRRFSSLVCDMLLVRLISLFIAGVDHRLYAIFLWPGKNPRNPSEWIIKLSTHQTALIFAQETAVAGATAVCRLSPAVITRPGLIFSASAVASAGLRALWWRLRRFRRDSAFWRKPHSPMELFRRTGICLWFCRCCRFVRLF